MKCRYAIGVAALSLCLGAAVAQAQFYYYLPEGAGPIFRVGVGPSFFQDGQITQFSTPGVAPTGPVPSKVDYNTGLAFDAAFGWAFNKYAALDFETGYIGAEINNVPGYLSDNSRFYNVPFLVNATLSYPIPRTNIIPYVGAGVGGADVVFDTDNFQDSAGINGVVGGENDVVFAGQVFAGVRFKLTHHLSLDLGYKYFATGNPTFTYPPDNFNVSFKGARTHSVLFGLTFDF
ncbi:MAG: outer membrane protein [Limisphaerales bacterium]